MSTGMALVWIVGSYLVGSVSFALLFTRLVARVDLRTVGSGNLGATNAGRALGHGWAVVIYACDFLKGFAPTGIGLWMLEPGAALADGVLPLPMLMGAAAFFGHCWPFYLGFKGGKGVATASGVILAVSWPAFVAAMIGFLLSVAIFRMISLGSVIGAFVLPIAYLATERRDAVVLPQLAWLTFFTFVTILVIARHRTNIIRIVEGQEPRVGRKAP